MKSIILFLDIDGVVSSTRNLITQTKYDQVALKLIEQLQNKYDFKIVLSSSHRKIIKDIGAWVKDIELNFGVKFNMHEKWRTVTGHANRVAKYDDSENNIAYWAKLNKVEPKDLTKEMTQYWRGWEIQEWLSEYEKEHGELPHYACIDDSRDLYPIPYQNYVHVEDGEQYSLQLTHYDALDAVFDRQINCGKEQS